MSEQQNTEEQVTAGAYLKRLRNEKNLSINEVAARMYLHRNVIEALEQDDHDSLLDAYIYGYLLHYAKILDVPADELVAMYRSDTTAPREQAAKLKQVPPPQIQPGPETKQPKRWSHAIIYLVLFILVLASFVFWRGKNSQEPVEITGKLDYPITVVEHPDSWSRTARAGMDEPERAPASPAAPEPGTIPEAETAQEPEIASEPEAAAAQGLDDEALATGTQAPETPAETAGTEPEAAPVYERTTITLGVGPDTVRLVLIVDCWIEIFDAENNKVFYDLARAGQTLVLGGTAPFSVLLGNADAATVEFNNTPFDITPHITGIGIARFVLGEAG